MFSSYVINERLKDVKGRKIIIWGIGVIGQLLWKHITENGYKVEFFIDSNSESAKFCNTPVYNPNSIKDSSREYYIFIAIQNLYEEIIELLDKWKYIKGADYFYVTQNYQILNEVSEYGDRLGNEIIGKPKCMNCTVEFRGANNKLVIEAGVKLQNTLIVFYNDNGYCHIGSNSLFDGTIHIGKECKIIIGKHVTVTSQCSISVAEYTEVHIGDDCMFASNNRIWSHDYHPIYDKTTGERINKSRSIHIGDHVWLGAEAVVLSGSRIEEGSVIGMRSVVKSNIPSNSMAAGIPASVKKTNIIWDRKNIQLIPECEYE